MPTIRQRDLVAVAMPPGPAWPEALRRLWDAGAAVLPIDHRLPGPEMTRLLSSARATAVSDGRTVERLAGGADVDDGVALVIPTSGTTGPPRLAELDDAALDAAIDASIRRLGATARDGWLCCLPLAHMGGLLVLARAMALGAPVVVQAEFDVGAFEGARDAAFTSLVPTMVVRLLAAQADLARFRAILVGGAPLPPSVTAGAARSGARLVATYGATESCGGVVYDGAPLDGAEVRIGDRGEVQLRGPTLFRGYRLDPDATQAALTPDGWLRTGDAGELVEGRLVVHGRLDDLIVTGGEKVWPGEVEAVLREHASVGDVLVAGSPDPEWGERVVAFVVPADPAAPPTLLGLRSAVGRALPSYKAPRELVIVDALPRTPSGKARRPSATGDAGPVRISE